MFTNLKYTKITLYICKDEIILMLAQKFKEVFENKFHFKPFIVLALGDAQYRQS